MAELNRMYPSNKVEDKAIDDYIDSIFVSIPEFDDFDLHKVIRNSELDEVKKKSARGILDSIKHRLIDKGYATYSTQPSYQIKLTELGREVKKTGGPNKYLQQQDREGQARQDRQNNEDTKVKLEMKDLKRRNVSYWVNWILTGISIIISLISLIIACNK